MGASDSSVDRSLSQPHKSSKDFFYYHNLHSHYESETIYASIHILIYPAIDKDLL